MGSKAVFFVAQLSRVDSSVVEDVSTQEKLSKSGVVPKQLKVCDAHAPFLNRGLDITLKGVQNDDNHMFFVMFLPDIHIVNPYGCVF